MKRCIIGLVLGLSFLHMATIAQAQDSMERGLLRQAPKLIKYFKDHGYKNVGVLKFLVSREGKGFSDNVGTLNLLAARRLEMALILANDPRTPVGIIDNASDVARNIAGASHLSSEGRKKLFTGQYPLAWGKDVVQPDAFVTGTTEISKDLRTLTVSLYGFDRDNNKLVPLSEDFAVANSTDRLAEMGQSFALRSIFEDGNVETVNSKQPAKVQPQQKTHQEKVYEEKVYKKAVEVYKQETIHPAHPQSDYKPVTLEVLYDGRHVPFEFRDGKAFLPEPNEGQKVQFGLRRDSSKVRYGVVLKVNGENTLDKQRQPDLSCRKWILGPGEGPWVISGYQIGTDKRENFRVASVAESREREISYGHDVGTITMTVFHEQKTKSRPMFPSEEAHYETVVKNLPHLPTRPNNYHALKAQFLEDVNRAPGGLILPGERVSNKIQTVTFVADPNPVMSITIVYYRK